MDLHNPHFAEPQWLWLALVGPLALVALQWRAAQSRKLKGHRFASPELWQRLTVSYSWRRRVFKEILCAMIFLVIGIALARPQWGEATEVSEAFGEDTLFILDCSKSMLANDVAPSRLARAKFAIQDFVQRHGRGRVGLVAFSGTAFLQCPLTFDTDAFLEALQSIDDKTIPLPGTDIGGALEEGFTAVEKSLRKKILILVTDGEDLENSGVATAKTLGKKGAIIYTIGVGTPAGSPIQILNDHGTPELLRDKDGSIVVSRLDVKALSAIAEAAHGNYHPLGSLGDGIEQIRHQIDNSATASDYSKLRKLGVDRFYLPVGATLLLMLIEPLFSTRRKNSYPIS